jgi:threonine dehydrogenase-like Zn-dependent dehydrogenase
VIGIDTAGKRLELAAAHGATGVIQARADEARGEIDRLIGKQGADVVYDVTGHPAVLASAMDLVRKKGTVVLLGDAGGPARQGLSDGFLGKGIKLVGAHDSLPPQTPNPWVRWSALQMYELFLTYIARKQIRLDGLITHRYKPQQAAEAYALLNRERETAMGVMFEWE